MSNPSPIRVGILGAAGRMGRRLVALAAEDADFRLGLAVDVPASGALGQDAGLLAGGAAGGVAITADLAGPVDVVIDFTSPAALGGVLDFCRRGRAAVVVGTTGLQPEHHALLDAAARDVPLVQAPNMSLGVNLLFALAAQAAVKLGEAYDIEITEAHHRFKKDAPSGTAWGLARAICQATGKDPQQAVVHGRHGDDAPRRPGEIGMHALRLGDVVGDHTVSFAALGERVELRHSASNRDVFARGALRAAKWLLRPRRAPGRYSMADVLGL